MRTRARRYRIRLGWWVALLLWFIVWIGLAGGFLYAAMHFILKYW